MHVDFVKYIYTWKNSYIEVNPRWYTGPVLVYRFNGQKGTLPVVFITMVHTISSIGNMLEPIYKKGAVSRKKQVIGQ